MERQNHMGSPKSRGLVIWGEKKESEVVQSCPTLRNPMDCSLPGPAIHGIFQARVLEWVAISFSYKEHFKKLEQGSHL